MSKLYTCTQCRKKKQINEFYLKKNGKPRESCKLCCKEQNKKYYSNNSAKVKETRKKYYDDNKEIELSKMKVYYENNKESFLEYSSKRRANKKQAIPIWLTAKHRSEIKSLYKMAKSISIKTGVQHHVDHIIPLTSDLVCGLHVPWNLQILPYYENLSKHNKLINEDIV